MKYLIISIVSIVIISSCRKEKQEIVYQIINSTNHKIIANEYKGNKLYKTTNLSNGLTFLWIEKNGDSKFVFDSDSLILIYDDSLQITHNSAKYSTNKNVYKLSNYQENKESDEKTTYKYEFIESDYQEALLKN